MRFDSPRDVRHACRMGKWSSVTAGLCGDYAQANLAILPADWAFDFLRFCQANPKPCPVLEVTDVGNPFLRLVAPGADLRTDLPRYRVYRQGELVDEVLDIAELWQDDFVGFLIGCSFSFEAELLAANIPVRHIELGCNVPMYRTNIPCRPAGRFQGPMVVSMRPMLANQAIQAIEITSRLRAVHGAPIHLGDPSLIGISDLDKPDYGDPVPVRQGEIPVFWACGVTPQAAALASKPPIMITHAPGHMLVTDLSNVELLKDW
ncbi:MAG: putative hydro-lyase [Firmicutes bacterium]|nr:putative hydro-lyase [Bacillota bacterium]